jgi:hypothetical protein
MRKSTAYLVLAILVACAVTIAVLAIQNPLRPAIALPAVLAVFVLIWVHSHWRFDDQKLCVFVPVLTNTPPVKILPLLEPDDLAIYLYLIRHGKTTPRADGVTIEYTGRHVYLPLTKQFRIDDKQYTPKAVKVESCQ